MSPTDPVLLHDAGAGRRIRKIGGVVRRPCYPFSPSVHALLRFLEDAGFPGAPRLLGVDDSGMEMLSFIEGVAGGESWDRVLSDDGLRSVAGLLRRYHEAVRHYRPPDGAEWSSGARGSGNATGNIILHGDPGPWNVVWRDDRAVGFIDWDHANPGQPLEDVAYLVAYTAPLCPDDVASNWMGHSRVPNRRHRLRLVADAYGVSPDGLVDLAAEVLAKTNRTVERMAAQGLEPQRSWVQSGLVRRFWERQEWIGAHRHDLV